MLLIKTLSELKIEIKKIRFINKRISLIPTMGSLHAGHMKLIKAGAVRSDITIVSIFVNPTQFDSISDLNNYPKNHIEDYKKLIKDGNTNIMFAPETCEMYPNGIAENTFIEVPLLSNILEGKKRLGHFRGVATIISKLFNLIQPNVVCFGEKDFQQLLLVRQLVRDMNYDIEIVGVPIVRDQNGLALSSRNINLKKKEQLKAIHINRALQFVLKKLKSNPDYQNYKKIENFLILNIKQYCFQHDLKLDTLDVRDMDSLKKINKNSIRIIILISAWIGNNRLIDNVQINLLKK